MKWFLNQKTAGKLAWSFGLLAALLMLAAYQGFSSMGRIQQSLENLYSRDMTAVVAVEEACVKQLRASRALRNTLLATDPAERRRQKADVEKFVAETAKQLEAASRVLTDPEAKQEMARALEALPAWRQRDLDAASLGVAGNVHEALARMKMATVENEQLRSALEKLIDLEQKISAKSHRDSAATYDRAVWMTSVISGMALLAAVGLALLLTRLISTPLMRAVRALDSVSEGDLTQTIPASTNDEVGLLASSFNRAVSRMRELLVEMAASSDQLFRASKELSSASDNLSRGTQTHASAQHETSATLEELSMTIRHNADNVKRASDLADESRSAAESGGEVVTSATKAIEEANSASRRISDIISTVDEIAFQTNLLALNAAVEAARAGEQGRGFAVVASEVRALAGRSAQAAREIRGLIDDSLRKVQNGSELVSRSGKTLSDIVGSVKQVSGAVTEIAQASKEQAIGIEQAAKAMAEMDQVTQANAAQTEELSAMAASLSQSAEHMQVMIRRFVLTRS